MIHPKAERDSSPIDKRYDAAGATSAAVCCQSTAEPSSRTTRSCWNLSKPRPRESRRRMSRRRTQLELEQVSNEPSFAVGSDSSSEFSIVHLLREDLDFALRRR